ncbi:MAG: MotA/TolQ/ExbB proton channel family protein [Candidatus Omnitrophica bacterium]|nr:MotA/TolQ/ExbB proton channel family protein [Candidatus Omnitrophota bacterium]MCM8776664.1 MotA/TolQ/ExbB proton channel family protein [Candidatus Omnitrophota bacterium]MCM8820693.1 MotA/TolQ/ExbB proton channel family protein [Candidatus Omnitrophota bacterium]
MENIWIASWKQSDVVGRFIIVVLVLLSLYSWKIILEKLFIFRDIEKKHRIFERQIKKGGNIRLLNCPLSNILNYGIEVRDRGNLENLQVYLEKAFIREAGKLEVKLTTLATTATISPFLGLLGTVWGLLLSFQGIAAAGSSSVRFVAGGVFTALITTVVGLIVAIPAAIGYNYYKERLNHILEKMEFLFPYLIEYLKSYSDRKG